jgi:hypothetical protein
MAISVAAIKGFSASSDGAEVTFTLATKYAGDMVVTMPSGCFEELVSNGRPAAPAAPARPEPTDSKPTESKSGQMKVAIPKKWTVTADLKINNVVLLIFDHQMETQAGFALTAKTTKELVTALAKNADAVLAHQPSSDG